MTDIEAARAAKTKLRARLGDHPHVVGIGLAKRQNAYVIKVNLSHDDVRVPRSIGGVAVERAVVGVIEARPAS